MRDWERVLKKKQKKPFLRHDVIHFESSNDRGKSLDYQKSSSYVMYTNDLPVLSHW